MRAHLVFALYGPMAAFGGVAVGERRGGEARPTRSALLGLLAASQGIARSETALLEAIERGYGVAVRVDAPGEAFTDYHTAQVPPAKRNVHHATRAEELAAPELETILSRRDYRTDALHTVVVWARESAPIPLETLKSGLQRPAFVLSLGRKSCPLGLPPGPVVVEAEDVLAAMAARPEPLPEQALRRRLGAEPRLLACDAGGLAGQIPPRWTETRRDAVASRARWQFGLRDELVYDLPLRGAA